MSRTAATHRCDSTPLYVLPVIVLLVLSSGCSDPHGLQQITGVVTLKGAPLKQGRIQFETADKQMKAYFSGAVITDGNYTVPSKSGLPPGKYRVTINSSSSPSFSPGPPGAIGPTITTKELIPAAYNVNSEQIVEVTAGDTNSFDFNIQ